MSEIKKSLPAMRNILYLASFLVLSVSLSLYFLPEKTDIYFSWTISPPLTAAFLGAGYLASFFLEFHSAREQTWANARPAVPGVWLFTFLTLIVTLVHLDRFHFDSTVFITLAGTWVWLIVYIVVPVSLGYVWWQQIRQPGGDPAVSAPLPGWMKFSLGVQGLIMLLVGAALLLASQNTAPFWPWKLSVLTARAIGAWGAGIGILTLQAAWEGDWPRLKSFFLSYSIYGLLQVFNLARYPANLDGPSLSVIFYIVFVTVILLTGVYGTLVIRKQQKSQS